MAGIDVSGGDVAPDNPRLDRFKIVAEQRLQTQPPQSSIRKLQPMDVLILRQHSMSPHKRHQPFEYPPPLRFRHKSKPQRRDHHIHVLISALPQFALDVFDAFIAEHPPRVTKSSLQVIEKARIDFERE